MFSPLLEVDDDRCVTTEALHLRKLFVAHILFGHERSLAGRGNINNPTALVRRLVNNGRVGPATNIGTDYYLLEAAGVVAVEPFGDRAYLKLVKRGKIVESGLDWIRRITDGRWDRRPSPDPTPQQICYPRGRANLRQRRCLPRDLGLVHQ